MSIVCAICRDYLIPSNDISYTRCGHVFHLNCLSQWLISSNSCPQCREPVSKNIRKLYITFSNNETDSDHNMDCSLQQKMDNLEFEILLNKKNMSHYISKNKTLKKQNAGLRQEVRKVESEISQKNSTIHSLKEEIKHFREKYEEYEKLKHKISHKERELEKLKKHIVKEACVKERLFSQLKRIKKWLINHCVEFSAMEERQSSKLRIEHLLKNCSLQSRDELEELLNIIVTQNRAMESDSQRKSSESSLTDVQDSTCDESNMQVSESQRDSIFPKKTKTKTTTNAYQDDCPIYKKKAKSS